MKKIYIYQRVLPHYRIQFFELLYQQLLRNGIHLTVIYGQEAPDTVPKTVRTTLPWGLFKRNIYIKLFGKELVIQTPIFRSLLDDSIVVLEQANRLLLNYAYFLTSLVSNKKVALWGHGRNFQTPARDGFRERLKKRYSNIVSWWFCYTQQGKLIVTNNGFAPKNVTVVNNSVDTQGLSSALDTLPTQDLLEIKAKTGVNSHNVAIYCGGMYTEKRILFLLESCLLVRAKVPDFEILFIGNGPDAGLVKSFCKENTWAHHLGPISGNERVKYFAISKCQLIPGLVGLGVLDSFALLTPLITTNIEYHSPEIDYLITGENGIISKNDLLDYTDNVISILTDDRQLEKLKSGCQKARLLYSIDKMATNFSGGILGLVNLPPKRSSFNSASKD